jgi:hypothetical protein
MSDDFYIIGSSHQNGLLNITRLCPHYSLSTCCVVCVCGGSRNLGTTVGTCKQLFRVIVIVILCSNRMTDGRGKDICYKISPFPPGEGYIAGRSSSSSNTLYLYQATIVSRRLINRIHSKRFLYLIVKSKPSSSISWRTREATRRAVLYPSKNEKRIRR